MYLVVCATVFVVAYLLNILTITVGYHRGLAHQAVKLRPWVQRLVVRGGPWVTGLDPKAWVVMHRMHHAFSDTPEDPHSPRNVGIFGIALAQLRSYQRVLVGLMTRKAAYTRYATDLDFEVGKLNRRGRWWLPYVVHALVGLTLALTIGWLLGVAYFAGMMSHPVQGGMVNALGHARGGRNFATGDDSRNNHVVAWLVFGEGFQNNHHAYPGSATFAYRRHEIDLGYGACRLFERLGMLEIKRGALIPAPDGPRRGRALETPTPSA